MVVFNVEAAAGITACTLGPLAGTVDGATAGCGTTITWVVPVTVVVGPTRVPTTGACTAGGGIV